MNLSMKEDYSENLSLETWAIPCYFENHKHFLISQYLENNFIDLDGWFKNYVNQSCRRWRYESLGEQLTRLEARLFAESLRSKLNPEDEKKISLHVPITS